MSNGQRNLIGQKNDHYRQIMDSNGQIIDSNGQIMDSNGQIIVEIGSG
ncbi:hypothetical protein [Rossellomorea sp. BNER]